MELIQARRIANSLVEAMQPYCVEIQVAGSIRRGKSECRDIELVAVPKYEERPNPDLLFGDPIQVNLLHEQVSNDAHIRWIKTGVTEIIDWSIKADGKYWRGLLPEGIKLDLFLTTVESFGLILTIRTGPATWSKELVTNQHKGGLLPDHMKVFSGSLWHGETRIETPTEQSVFDAIDIPFIPPEARGLRPPKT